MMRVLVAVLVLGLVQGCSVVQATSGPEAKDLSVLDVGAPRDRVLLEFGAPVATESLADGGRYDLFSFRQGQHGAAKAGKALGYGLLAIYTLGLSEVVTSPLEGAAGKGAEMQLKVIYSADDTISEVQVLKDERWMPVQDLPKAE